MSLQTYFEDLLLRVGFDKPIINKHWETLNKSSQDFLQDYVYIFSGLFGMLTPMTPIPDYKLKMNVLSLQHHWNPILSEALQEEIS